MKKIKGITLFICLAIVFAYYGCSSDSDDELKTKGTAKISITLVDAPGDFQHVYVEVTDVMIKIKGDSNDDDSWTSVDGKAGIYDLLELTGGVNEILVDDYEVPSGELSQIRLILGENNSVVIDGQTHPLKTPSAQQSGLKIKVNQELEDGFTYNFILDFDADKSVVIAGNSGNINLKPVINASLEVISGKIQGVISPSGVQTLVSVEVEGETRSTYIDEDGVFVLNGIPSGVYTVKITPDIDSGLMETEVNDVEVVAGNVTDLREIVLQ